MSKKPELDDYLAFFEAEPEIVTPGTEWYYGARFISVRGADRIEAVVSPDEGEFSFKWWQADQLRVDLTFVRVVEWVLERKAGAEHLVLKFESPTDEFFMLQLRPHICITSHGSWA